MKRRRDERRARSERQRTRESRREREGTFFLQLYYFGYNLFCEVTRSF